MSNSPIHLGRFGCDRDGRALGLRKDGRGGEAPTVTDADLLLGFLNADYFAGGSMKIDRDAAERAMQPLAARTGLSMIDLARGIYEVVNENMASAARVHIAEQGKDGASKPRARNVSPKAADCHSTFPPSS